MSIIPSPVEGVTSTLVHGLVTCQTGDAMFDFISDRPVLDFLPTLAARGTAEEEKLRDPDDLATWVRESGIVDDPGPVSHDDLERARTARETFFRLVAALIDGRLADPADRAFVEDLACDDLPMLHVGVTGLSRTGDLSSVLAVLARDCLELHGGPDRAALHWCADETCTRPFVDRSRGGRRKWCGMRGCGDRAKAAAYRERRRAGRA